MTRRAVVGAAVLAALILPFAVTAQQPRVERRIVQAADPLAGKWDITHTHKGFGDVRAKAEVTRDGKGVSITFKYRGAEITLAATSVTREGNRVTMIFPPDLPETPVPFEALRPPRELLAGDPLPTVSIGVGGTTTLITASLEGATVEAPLDGPRTRRLEIVLTQHPDGRTEGTWRRLTAGGDEIDSGAQRWFAANPRIVGIVVINDQTARDEGGAYYRYPFDNPPAGGQSLNRKLLVYGYHLPQEPGERAKMDAMGQPIDYYWRASLSSVEGNPIGEEDFERGWAKVEGGRKPGWTALMVNAQLKEGVTPGQKPLRLNGEIVGFWQLEFGDSRGTFTFAREVYSDRYEATSEVLDREHVVVQIETEGRLPMKEIPIVIGRNGDPVKFGKQDSIIARRVGGETSKLYRTGQIALQHPSDATRSPPPRQGQVTVGVGRGDSLLASLLDPALLRTEPPIARATVISAGDLGALWKSALKRAAACHEKFDYDWDNIAQKKADEVSNIIVFQLERMSIRVNFGDQAAMILLRDEFVASMGRIKTEYQGIVASKANIAKFFKMMERFKYNDTLPFNKVEVAAPDGSRIDFSGIYTEAWLKRTYSLNDRQLHRWQIEQTEAALKKFIAGVQGSIDTANAAGDCDVEELLAVTGSGFNAVIAKLEPKLMKLEEQRSPRRLYWVPDRPARSYVRGLATLARAVKDQRAVAKIDNTMIALSLAAVSVGAAPLLGEGVLAAVVTLGVDAADLAFTLATELPHYFQGQKEIAFAQGAAVLLGNERADRAKLEASSWYGTALAVFGSGLGSSFSAYRAMSTISEANAVRRGATLMSRVQSEGVGALSDAEKTDVLAYLGRAETAREAGKLDDGQRAALDWMEGQAARNAPPETRVASNAPADDAARAGPTATDTSVPRLDGETAGARVDGAPTTGGPPAATPARGSDGRGLAGALENRPPRAGAGTATNTADAGRVSDSADAGRVAEATEGGRVADAADAGRTGDAAGAGRNADTAGAGRSGDSADAGRTGDAATAGRGDEAAGAGRRGGADGGDARRGGDRSAGPARGDDAGRTRTAAAETPPARTDRTRGSAGADRPRSTARPDGRRAVRDPAAPAAPPRGSRPGPRDPGTPTTRLPEPDLPPARRTGDPDDFRETVRLGPDGRPVAPPTTPTTRLPEPDLPTARRTGDPDDFRETVRLGPDGRPVAPPTTPTTRLPEPDLPTARRTGDPDDFRETVRLGPDGRPVAPPTTPTTRLPDPDLPTARRTGNPDDFRETARLSPPVRPAADPAATRRLPEPDLPPATPARGADAAKVDEVTDQLRSTARQRAAEAEATARRALDEGREIPEQTADRLRREITANHLQEAVDARIADARRAGVPEDEIAEMLGRPGAYDTNPVVMREMALSQLEEAVLKRRGFDIVGSDVTRPFTETSTRVLAGSATPADLRYLADRIADAQRRGADYFDELAKQGRMDYQDGFQPLATREVADRMRDFARRNGLLDDAGSAARNAPDAADGTRTARLGPDGRPIDPAPAPTARLPEPDLPGARRTGDPDDFRETVRLGPDGRPIDPSATRRLGEPELPTARRTGDPEDFKDTVRLGPDGRPRVTGPEARAPTERLGPGGTERLTDPARRAPTERLGPTGTERMTGPTGTERMAPPAPPPGTARLPKPDLPPADPDAAMKAFFAKPGRLDGADLDKAVDIVHRRFGGDWDAVAAAAKTGEIGPENARLVNQLRKDLDDYLAVESGVVTANLRRIGEPAATPDQIRFWKQHDGFRRQLEDGALDLIRRAADDGNDTARAFLAHLDAGNFKIKLDPEVAGLGYYMNRVQRADGSVGMGDTVYVSPFFRSEQLTGGASKLRTLDDTASTMLHEFVHRMGHGELRAWQEQYNFLNQVGRRGGSKFELASEYDAFRKAHGETSAIGLLQAELKARYASKYDPAKLARHTAVDPTTFQRIPMPDEIEKLAHLDMPTRRFAPGATTPGGTTRLDPAGTGSARFDPGESRRGLDPDALTGTGGPPLRRGADPDALTGSGAPLPVRSGTQPPAPVATAAPPPRRGFGADPGGAGGLPPRSAPALPRNLEPTPPIRDLPPPEVGDMVPTKAGPARIGEELGRGNYATVHRMTHPEHGDVAVKFIRRKGLPDPDQLQNSSLVGTAPRGSGAQVAQDSLYGAKLLDEAGIPQLRILESSADAQNPYLIQQRLPDDAVTFKLEPNVGKDGRVHTTIRDRNGDVVDALSEGQQRAVVDLYRKFADKGLVWEDGHLENMFFRKLPGDDDKWVAGVLDQDRIAPYRRTTAPRAEVPERLQNRIDIMQSHPTLGPNSADFMGLESLRNAPRDAWPDADFAMQKMFEYRSRFVRYSRNADGTGAFEGTVVDPRLIEEQFPGFLRNVDRMPAPPAAAPGATGGAPARPPGAAPPETPSPATGGDRRGRLDPRLAPHPGIANRRAA